jgi:hypothetical protein
MHGASGVMRNWRLARDPQSVLAAGESPVAKTLWDSLSQSLHGIR